MQYKSVTAQAMEFYAKYKTLPEELDKINANVDYVAMMTDVELEPTSNNDSDTSEQTE